MKKELTIREWQSTVDQWIKDVGKGYYSELTNMAILTEEVGELARYISRMYGQQTFKRENKSNDERKQDMAKEMADVLWVLFCLANQTGVSLTEVMQENLKKKTERDKERHAKRLKR